MAAYGGGYCAWNKHWPTIQASIDCTVGDDSRGCRRGRRQDVHLHHGHRQAARHGRCGGVRARLGCAAYLAWRGRPENTALDAELEHALTHDLAYILHYRDVRAQEPLLQKTALG